MGTTKRTNGLGSIDTLPSGSFRLRWTDRRRVPQSMTLPKGTSRRQAEARLAQLVSDADRGVTLAPADYTVDRWLDDFQAAYFRTIEPSTQRLYVHAIEHRIRPSLGLVALRDLGPDDISAALDDWQRAGVSPVMQRAALIKLRTILKLATVKGLLVANPALAVPLPKARTQRVHPPTPATVDTVLRAAKGTRLEAAYLLAATTGMRQGELLALTWDDLDLDAARPQVRITKNLQQTGRGGRIVEHTKTPASRRTVDLLPGVVARLRVIRGTTEGHLPVVPSVKRPGQPVAPNTLCDNHLAFVASLGLPHFTWHDFRHYVAWRLLVVGRQRLEFVSKFLGHASYTITANTYGHLVASDLDASSLDFAA